MLYSCQDDFLERSPLDQISDPEFWNSQSDLELFLNSFYDSFQGWPASGGGKAPTKDEGTDFAMEGLNAFGGTVYPTYGWCFKRSGFWWWLELEQYPKHQLFP